VGNSSVPVLGFLIVFHIMGAIALGASIRGLWRAIDGDAEGLFGHLFFLIFGGLFSCAPFVYGLSAFDPVPILTVQLSVVIVVFIISLFLGPAIVRITTGLFNINGGLVLLGLLFIGGGLFAGFSMVNQGEPLLTGLIAGAVFGLIGLGIALLGLGNYFRNRDS
jgi:hypothetical protein